MPQCYAECFSVFCIQSKCTLCLPLFCFWKTMPSKKLFIAKKRACRRPNHIQITDITETNSFTTSFFFDVLDVGHINILSKSEEKIGFHFRVDLVPEWILFMFFWIWDIRKPHTDTGGTCKLQRERPHILLKSRTFCCKAKVLNNMPLVWSVGDSFYWMWSKEDEPVMGDAHGEWRLLMWLHIISIGDENVMSVW